jgi:hypothetical protein
MKCTYTKLDGNDCRAESMVGAGLCFSHNPESRKQKKLAATRGGLAPKTNYIAKQLKPIKVTDAEDLKHLINDSINRVRTEPFTHHKANSVGYLSNILLKIFQSTNSLEPNKFVGIPILGDFQVPLPEQPSIEQ